MKAQARLALLASAGVDVDSWVSSAMDQADEELERGRRLSEARLSNGDISSLVSFSQVPLGRIRGHILIAWTCVIYFL